MRRPALLLLLAAAAAAQQAPGIVLDGALHHLGDTRTPEWTGVSVEPEGVKLELRFMGHDMGRE